MIPIIDFSYFSLNEFHKELRRKNNTTTSSLLLYTDMHQSWDLLFEQSPNLWAYIHEQSGRFHDTFIPVIPSEHFINRFSFHLRKVLEPAQERIKTVLYEIGVEDVEEYMEDSLDWISLYLQRRNNNITPVN